MPNKASTEEVQQMEVEDAIQMRINEMRQLLSQMGDFETAAEVGVIDQGELRERRARKATYTRVLALAESGEAVSDDDVAAILDEERVKAEEPTAAEQMRGDLDFALMLLGEE